MWGEPYWARLANPQGSRPSIASDSELTQVVIDVAVSPAHPFALGEPAEHRRRLDFEVAPWSGEALDEDLQVGDIPREIGGLRSALLLIHFRQRRHTTLRPRQRRVQRDEAHECGAEEHL